VVASVCTDSLLAGALLHFTRQKKPSTVDAYTYVYITVLPPKSLANEYGHAGSLDG
jgi:hypothetical protein